MTSPNEVERALKMVHIRCTHCNKILGHMGETYSDLIASKKKPFEAFKILGLTRYCCKMDLANPSQIAPGLIYNNPRQEGSIKFASQGAVRLLGELSVNRHTESPLVTVRRGFVSGSEIRISRPVRLATLLPKAKPAEMQEMNRHTSTATLSGMSIGKEREPRPTEQNDITSENFSPEMIQLFKDKMTGKDVSQSSFGTSYTVPQDVPSITTPFSAMVPSLGPVSISPIPRATVPSFTISDVVPPSQFLPQSTTTEPTTGGSKLSMLMGLLDRPKPRPEAEIIAVSQTPTIVPTHLAEQSIDIDTSTTQNLFLPTIIRRPDPDNLGQMIMVRQFSGV